MFIRWASSFFNRMSTSTNIRENEYEHPLETVPSSTDSEQSASPAPSPTKQSSTNSASSPQTSPSPSAIATVLGQGSKNEHATFTDPEILYRYPDDADPPPPEVICLFYKYYFIK